MFPAPASTMKNVLLFCCSFSLLSLSPSTRAEPSNFAAGRSVLGRSDFFGDGDFMSHVPPTATEFNFPEGVAVDPLTGKVFVADSENNRILKFSSTDAYRTGAAAEAVLGQDNFTSNDANQGGSPAADTLSYPLMLAFDSEGRLYVTDWENFRVLRYDDASNKVNGAAADGVLGQADFTSVVQGGNTTDTVDELKFASPTGIVVDALGNLWVADNAQERVVRYDNAVTKSGLATPDCVLGQIDLKTFDIDTAAQDKFVDPYGISIGQNGELWVADAAANRVLRFDNAATLMDGASASGLLGQDDFADDALAMTVGRDNFYNPFYVTCAPNGTLWVSDYTNVRVLGFRNVATKSGLVDADVVLGHPNFTNSDHRPSDQRSLRGPAQIAIGKEGSLLVAVYDQSRVMRFSDDVTVAPIKRKIVTKRKRATIRGRSSGANRVEVQIVGQGGYKNARGIVSNWKAKTKKLTRRATRVKIRAIAFDGFTATSKAKVIVKKKRR